MSTELSLVSNISLPPSPFFFSLSHHAQMPALLGKCGQFTVRIFVGIGGFGLVKGGHREKLICVGS